MFTPKWCPRMDSSHQHPRFERGASANWATGAYLVPQVGIAPTSKDFQSLANLSQLQRQNGGADRTCTDIYLGCNQGHTILVTAPYWYLRSDSNRHFTNFKSVASPCWATQAWISEYGLDANPQHYRFTRHHIRWDFLRVQNYGTSFCNLGSGYTHHRRHIRKYYRWFDG